MRSQKRHRKLASTLLVVLCFGWVMSPADIRAQDPPKIKRTIKAEVVALNQCFMLNRMGASMPQGMIFALKHDVKPIDGKCDDPDSKLEPGKVRLCDSKRPRPIVLRCNVGDCLEITFTNLLSPTPFSGKASGTSQPLTRTAGVHVMGMEMLDSIKSDASYVGPAAQNSLCKPGETKVYKLYAKAEGTFLLYSTAADFPGGGNQLMCGLFGAVNVEPEGSKWYRSQVTQAQFARAAKKNPKCEFDLPTIDYEAVDANKKPILNLLKGTKDPSVYQLMYSDLTAIIAGPLEGGRFPPPPASIPKNPVYPNRTEPYREITILYHDAFNVVQAFNPNDPEFATAMGNGGEAFAINYGSAGIGAEVLANRLGVGPMWNTAEAKFEEFFLSSWVCGDPAMIVDVPANSSVPKILPGAQAPCLNIIPPGSKPPIPKGPKATKAYYPDDPSNVYHSYLNDRVIFRILHAGSLVPHVHHQHAHQWLRTPASDSSMLLDSQTITAGDGMTLDIIYGSGNRNLTAGDSIFHCHFYPHFAGGLWALWRVHDVFEEGTELDKDGRPKAGARALPDGEIAAGTPIPGLIPMPSLPMAPRPAKIKIVTAKDPNNNPVGYKAIVDDPDPEKSPGYPFFIPGIGGRRAPHPPLDFAIDETTKKPLDGGLPRHLILAGKTSYEKHNAFDFSKDVTDLIGIELPENGTPDEIAAMRFHGTRKHPTALPNGDCKDVFFITNGTGPKPGAPYANPAVDLNGKAIDEPFRFVRYKAADVQMDVVFNKKGWHYPQQRLTTLWGDVKDTLDGTRAPEPLFFRANSGDVIEYWLTNLIPFYYELDDFQVRTPTDVIGQHIHLVKFDVTSSDGAANGFNYEDGSFSPDEVRSRIAGINKMKGLWNFGATKQKPLAPSTIPFFGPGPGGAWVGAQTTVQRWYADPLKDSKGLDRTLGTVFTHDHLGPSTHQQAGLYAGLLIEPAQSIWLDNSTAKQLGKRDAAPINKGAKPTKDGGPTSWAAVIVATDPRTLKDVSYREFAMAFQDFQLAYDRNSLTAPKPYVPYAGTNPPAGGWGWVDPAHAIAAPQGNPLPAPGLISSPPEPGTRSLNYRNEPIPFRVKGPAGQDNTDMSQAFRSIKRVDADLNQQPTGPIKPGSPFLFPGPFKGAGAFDPYTPLMRAYAGDDVQLRVLVGAHHQPHSFLMHGVNWLTEKNFADSGYSDSQVMSISEHFEFQFKVPIAKTNVVEKGTTPSTDYLYMPSSDTDGVANGIWGLLRAYNMQSVGKGLPDLTRLPSNLRGAPPPGTEAKIGAFFQKLRDDKQSVKSYTVIATTINKLYANAADQQLIYYARGSNPAADPGGLVYVLKEDLDPKTGFLLPGKRLEPLTLWANAGDLIQVTLVNQFDTKQSVFTTPMSFQPGGPLAFSSVKDFPCFPSVNVGLHAQMLAYDITQSNGFNVGQNPVQTVAPGASSMRTYEWYAGRLNIDGKGNVTGIPIEFGVVNLTPADPSFQHKHGLFGALIIEPAGSKRVADGHSRLSATVYPAPGSKELPFREFVLINQDQTYNSNLTAYNYKSENMSLRYGATLANGPNFNGTDLTGATSNDLVGSGPQTPTFTAAAGQPVRFRLLHTFGNDYTAWTLHGHVWQASPYQDQSRRLGFNALSDWQGSAVHIPPSGRFDVLIDSAGGSFKVPGDYLYRSFDANGFQDGQWGIFHVHRADTEAIVVSNVEKKGDLLHIRGRLGKDPKTDKFADEVTLSSDGKDFGKAKVDPLTGAFSANVKAPAKLDKLTVTSSGGAVRQLALAPRLEAAPPHPELTHAQQRALRFSPRRPTPK